MAMVRRLLDGLNHEEFLDPAYEPSYTDQHVVAVHCYHNLVLIQKGENLEGTNKRGADREWYQENPSPRSSQSRNTTGSRTLHDGNTGRRTTKPASPSLTSIGVAGADDGVRAQAPIAHSWRFHGRLLRLDARGDGPRPHDDDPGTRPVLRRDDPVEVRAQHDDDVLHRARGRRHRVRPVGLVRGVGRRRRRQRQRQADRQPVHDVRPARRHEQQLHLRALPAHLRGDHRGPDLRRHRRPREAVLLDRLPADLGHALLLPDRPQRLGRRLVLLAHPEPGLRRWHGRAHQRRYRRRRARAASSAAGSASCATR